MSARIPAAPVLDEEAATERVERLRAAGASSIAVATGVFEILHAGHVRFLEEAARQAELLVVGVTADDEVEQSRGAGRPVLSAVDRAAMVAGLNCVDLVVVYQGPDRALLDRVRPDIVCRSGSIDGGAEARAAAPWRLVAIASDSDPVDVVARLGELEP